MAKEAVTRNYDKLLSGIGALLEGGRRKVVMNANNIIVNTYWNIGKQIVEFEQKGKIKAEYGSGTLDKLSTDLIKRYGKGFSRDNLERMRKFYLFFKNSETLSRKLSWSHYCAILRLDDGLARNFYIKEVEKEGWSIRELARNINSMLFERIALSKDKKGVLELSKRGHIVEKAEDLIKDPYVLEFLGLEELHRYTETNLEERITTNLEKFLLELGKGFMFVARQQRITIEDEHFYIDLVFYNRILKCFVLIELKIGKLTHQDLGQLQMYVNYYDRKIKQDDENHTVGILLCADKKEAIVQFSLPKENRQIFASKYKIYLPNKEELQERLRKLLE